MKKIFILTLLCSILVVSPVFAQEQPQNMPGLSQALAVLPPVSSSCYSFPGSVTTAAACSISGQSGQNIYITGWGGNIISTGSVAAGSLDQFEVEDNTSFTIAMGQVVGANPNTTGDNNAGLIVYGMNVKVTTSAGDGVLCGFNAGVTNAKESAFCTYYYGP